MCKVTVGVCMCVLASSVDKVMHGDQCELVTGMWRTTLDHPAAAASVFHYRGEKKERKRGRTSGRTFFPVIAQAPHNLKPSPTNAKKKEKNNNKDLLPIQESTSLIGLMVTPCATAAVTTQPRSTITFYSYNSQWKGKYQWNIKGRVPFALYVRTWCPGSVRVHLYWTVSICFRINVTKSNCCGYCTWRLRWFLF